MIRTILISETMRLEGLEEAVGVWEPREERIVIKRSQLRSLRDYAATLLHETAHATSGAIDISARFEDERSRTLAASEELALTLTPFSPRKASILAATTTNRSFLHHILTDAVLG